MPTTTAATLAAYRADLLAADIPEPLADAVVMDAAQQLHRGIDEIAVSTETRDAKANSVAEAAEAKRTARAAELAAS